MPSDGAERIDLSAESPNQTPYGEVRAVRSDHIPASENANSPFRSRHSLTRAQKTATLLIITMLVLLAGHAASRRPQIVAEPAACDDRHACKSLGTTRPQVDPYSSSAPSLHSSKELKTNANQHQVGQIRSSKTGARARVGFLYAKRFQAYVDDLENNYGARVLFMGGIRRGHCSISSQHPCGKALDVCQLRRGVVDPRCRLPDRVALAKIAASHGLFEGGRWCNSDYGHAQVEFTSACGDRHVHTARRPRTGPAALAQLAPM
jgi:hypothetical protein